MGLGFRIQGLGLRVGHSTEVLIAGWGKFGLRLADWFRGGRGSMEGNLTSGGGPFLTS